MLINQRVWGREAVCNDSSGKGPGGGVERDNGKVTERAKDGGRKILVRITAAVLAAVMLAGIVLYRQTEIAVDPGPMENKAVRLAAKQLLAENDYANASRIERMSRYAQNLFTVKGSSAAYESAGNIAIAQGNYQEAITLTARAAELFEGSDAGAAELYLRLGYLHVMTGEFEEARKWLDLGIELNGDPEARLARAQVLVNLGETDRALEDVTAYLQTAEDAEEKLADLINVFEAAGDYETATRFYTRLIDSTGSTEYYLNRACCYTSLGQMDQAAADREVYGNAGGAEIAAADVMLGIGWMRAGEYGKADDCFIRALDEQYPDPQSLYYYVVLCAYITKQFDRVCEYGDRLIERMNRGEDAGTASIGVEKTTGRLKVTLAKTDPASLCLMTGAAHVQRGDFDQAVDSLTACLQQNGEAAYANYLRGSCLLAAEKYAEAVVDFDAALAAGEEPEKSHYSRGICRMQLGDTAGAMEDFDWVLLNGTDEELFHEASVLLAQLLNRDETAGQPETGPASQED